MKMRKRFLMLSCFVFCAIFFSGCEQPENDYNHAIAEITTSSGKSAVKKSYNADSGGYSGSAKAINNPYKLKIEGDNDTVNIHFFCETCGYDEVYEAGVPTAKLFSCQCPEERKEGDVSIREYFCVKISKK